MAGSVDKVVQLKIELSETEFAVALVLFGIGGVWAITELFILSALHYVISRLPEPLRPADLASAAEGLRRAADALETWRPLLEPVTDAPER
jgi:hypothetical protein